MREFTGRQYLQMDIASNFGITAGWDERLNWFQQHKDMLHSLAPDAKEPAQYLAGVLAWEKVQQGMPTGFMAGWDASASGMQLLSILAGCPLSASMCNVINVNGIVDGYTKLYEHLCAAMGTIGKIPRKDVKRAVMTHLYKSKKVPKEVFGEDTPELAQFYKSVETLLPGANQLNEDISRLWQDKALEHSWSLPDGFEVVVKVMTPVDETITVFGESFKVTRYVNAPQEDGLSLSANVIHSIDGMIVREMGRRCNYGEPVLRFRDLMESGSTGAERTDRCKDIDLLRIITQYQDTGFLSAVIYEHLDEDNLRHIFNAGMMPALAALFDSLPDYSFHLITVHDMFKASPLHGNHVRQQYINILAELADSDILSSIASSITNGRVRVKKVSSDLGSLIRQSEYPIN